MPRISKQERAEAIETLRKYLSVGDTVHCILRHVSSSGRTRVVQFVKMRDGDPLYLGYSLATALGLTYDRKYEGVKMQGCGMDVGFEGVYNLGRVLFPDGFGVAAQAWSPLSLDPTTRPQSREEAARMAAEGYKFYGRNGDTSGWDNDGGYALNYRWL